MFMQPDAERFVDVNAAAGTLREIFAVDVTTATSKCNACGRVAPFAECYVYSMEPGVVVRCNNCKSVLMRSVMGRGCAWLDLHGLNFLQLRLSPEDGDSSSRGRHS